MRTRKQELVSDDLKPFVCAILKEHREKYNYSLDNEFFGSGVFNDTDWSREGYEDI